MSPRSAEVLTAIVDGQSPGHARTLSTPRIGLSSFDRSAAATFTSGCDQELAEHVRAHAEALATGGREARRRTLARAYARAAIQLANLETLLGERLAKRDEEGVKMLSRLIGTATSRMLAINAELRREEQGERPVVVFAKADNFNITGAR